MAKPGSDRDGAMVDKQAGKKVRELQTQTFISANDISATNAAWTQLVFIVGFFAQILKP